MEDEKPAPVCTPCKNGFNYCLWAKLIVGVPAIFIVVYIVAMQFTNPWLQMLAGAASAFACVIIAMKIDRMPIFSRMVVKRQKD